MKFSLLAVAFIGLFMVAMTPARASPYVASFDDFSAVTYDFDVGTILRRAIDGAEDFDRMSVVTTNIIKNDKPLRTPYGLGVASSLTMTSHGSEVTLTGVGISS